MPRHLIVAMGVFGYKLYLNNMLGRYKDQLVFGPFETLTEVEAFYKKESVEPYDNEGPDMLHHGYMKHYTCYFRKGGPLEWCHPFHSEYQWHKLDPCGAGVCEELLSVINVEKRCPHESS